MPYGGISYSQSPQLDSPLQHSASLVVPPQHMGSSTTNVYTTGSESNGVGSPSASAVTSSALQTTSQAALTTSLFRNDDKRLTREAMEKYLRNRNDMIIVILHAKVITYSFACCLVIQATATTTTKKKNIVKTACMHSCSHFQSSTSFCYYCFPAFYLLFSIKGTLYFTIVQILMILY